MNEWKSFKLSELGQIIGGSTPSTRNSMNYEGGHISWITPKDLSNHFRRFIAQGARNITEQGLKNCSAQLIPKNSILFSSRAPIGYLAIAEKELCTNQGFKSIVPNDRTNYMFLYYLLKFNKEKIEYISSGTTFKEISGSAMKRFSVCVPPLETQKKIAAVLSALDDKIELNNAINKNLEEQAQAIFKSWFIDFEPFGGTMPDDWEFKNLGNVTDNIRERITNFNTPVFSAVNTGRLVLSDEFFYKRVYSKDIKKYLLVREGDFAYNPARINIGSIGLNDFGYEGCVSPVYVVVRVNANYRAFFRFYFKTKTFAEECLSRGSGSVRQSLNYDDFSLIEMIYPSNEYARKFNELWENYFFVIQNISRENQKLGELRDALLPRLMSGEIDVSKVEI